MSAKPHFPAAAVGHTPLLLLLLLLQVTLPCCCCCWPHFPAAVAAAAAGHTSLLLLLMLLLQVTIPGYVSQFAPYEALLQQYPGGPVLDPR